MTPSYIDSDFFAEHVHGPDMDDADQFEAIQPIRNEIQREQQDNFENHPEFLFFHPFPNQTMLVHKEACMIVESVVSAVADEIEEVEHVQGDTCAVVFAHAGRVEVKRVAGEAKGTSSGCRRNCTGHRRT
jgi:hypothetical protein